MDQVPTETPESAWTFKLVAKFLLLCTGVWLYAADTLVTATVAPAMVANIGGVSLINWTLSVYEIGAIIAGAVTPVLCQRFGVKQVLNAAALLYAAGCSLSGLAPSIEWVLVGRLLQGLAGGTLLSLCYVAINEWFPQSMWKRLFGIVAAIWGIGSLLGPLIGGFFATAERWRGAFFCFAAQAALLMVVASLYLPKDASKSAAGQRWPWQALALLSCATLAIAAAGISSRLPVAVAECLVGIAGLYLAARADRLAANRMLPATLLNVREPMGAGLIMVFLLAVSTTGFWTYGPLLLKVLFNVTPLLSGYILASEALAWSFATLAIGSLPDRLERHLIRWGTLIIAAGAAGFTLAVPSGSLSAMVACALLQGGGFGLCWPSIVHRLVRLRGGEPQALTSAAGSILQRVGYAVGAAAAGIAANACGLNDNISLSAARGAAVWVFAAFVPLLIVALLLAWTFSRATEEDAGPLAEPAGDPVS
jgi:MFS family permease